MVWLFAARRAPTICQQCTGKAGPIHFLGATHTHTPTHTYKPVTLCIKGGGKCVCVCECVSVCVKACTQTQNGQGCLVCTRAGLRYTNTTGTHIFSPSNANAHTRTRTHNHTQTRTHNALTACLAATPDGLAALLPWQTSDGWRAEKMKERKGWRGVSVCVCECVCVCVLEERKELSAVVLGAREGLTWGQADSFPPRQHVSFPLNKQPFCEQESGSSPPSPSVLLWLLYMCEEVYVYD